MRYISFPLPYKSATELNLAVKPVEWVYLSMPSWHLFNFFNENYIPLTFILLAILTTAFHFYKNFEKFNFFIFINFSTFLSILLYEIGSRGVYGSRIYLFAEALLVYACLSSIYLLLKTIFKQRITLVILSIVTFVIIISIKPNCFQVITARYGDDVTSDPFRTTDVAAYRSDYKTTNEYIRQRITDNDILIAVMGTNYFNLSRKPDYILNENVRWNTGALLDSGDNFISVESGSRLINTSSQIETIVKKNSNKRVWLLVNGGSLKILSTTHVREDFNTFLNANIDKTVFLSEDGISKVLLFNSNK